MPADFSRTLLVAKGDQIGTAFLHSHSGRWYWVTSRSFLRATPQDTIIAYYAGRPLPISIHVLNALTATDEVAVFEIPGMNIPAATPATPDALIRDTIVEAAQGWLLSYPMQLVADVLPNMLPKPFVTRATIAAVNYDTQLLPTVYYMDGQYHRGCTGAPVYAGNSAGHLRLIGIAIEPITEALGADPKLQVNSGLFRVAPLWLADAIIEASQRH